jgi:hypothetical protein
VSHVATGRKGGLAPDSAAEGRSLYHLVFVVCFLLLLIIFPSQAPNIISHNSLLQSTQQHTANNHRAHAGWKGSSVSLILIAVCLSFPCDSYTRIKGRGWLLTACRLGIRMVFISRACSPHPLKTTIPSCHSARDAATSPRVHVAPPPCGPWAPGGA